MCRLFAFSFNKDTEQEKRVFYINTFRQLSITGSVAVTSSPGHADGWGIAVYEENKEPYVYKSIVSAALDTDFVPSAFLKAKIAESGLVHLRKKTVGGTTIQNTHPFTEKKYSFIHNGTVAKGDEPYAVLTKECAGDTDSERLFRHFLEITKTGIKTEEAYRMMLRETLASYPTFSAINTVLHDGERIYVSRVMNTNYPEYEERHLEKYYTLYIGSNNHGDIFVSSEQLAHDDTRYSLLANNSVCVIDIAKGTHVVTTLL